MKADADDSPVYDPFNELPAAGDYVNRFLGGGPPGLRVDDACDGLHADDEDPPAWEGLETAHEVPLHDEGDEVAEIPHEAAGGDVLPAEDLPDHEMDGPAHEVPAGDEGDEVAEIPYEAAGDGPAEDLPDDEMESPADEVPAGDSAFDDNMDLEPPMEVEVETADGEGLEPPLPPPSDEEPGELHGLAPLPPPDYPPSEEEAGMDELPAHLAALPVPPPIPASRMLLQPPAPPHGSILAFFVITCFLHFRLGAGWNALNWYDDQLSSFDKKRPSVRTFIIQCKGTISQNFHCLNQGVQRQWNDRAWGGGNAHHAHPWRQRGSDGYMSQCLVVKLYSRPTFCQEVCVCVCCCTPSVVDLNGHRFPNQCR